MGWAVGEGMTVTVQHLLLLANLAQGDSAEQRNGGEVST